MTTLDCINILKKVRQRAVISTPSQLLDYIDGQIDTLVTIDSTSIDSTSSGHSNTIPRNPADNGSTVAVITPAALPPRFRGADMD